MITKYKQIVAGALGALALAFLPALQAAPTLRISNGANTVTIVDGGPMDSNATAGAITFVDATGVTFPGWNLVVTTGLTKPATGSNLAPFMDIQPNALSTGAGTLTFEFSDTDFGPIYDTRAIHTEAGFNVAAGGTLTYSTYVSQTNGLFDESAPLASPLICVGLGGLSSDAVISGLTKFSLTQKIVITHTAAGRSTTDSTLDDLGPSGAIGDYVWKDMNANGIQDVGEVGIDGVTVWLKDSNGNIIATTLTQPNGSDHGYYLFTGLAAGTYYVMVDNSSPALTGCIPTTVGAGTPSTDSNNPMLPVILATDESVDLTIDFGYRSPPPTGRLGDFVWKDTNSNGIQDNGEMGINGVVVQLLDSNGGLLSTTTTVNNGVNDGYYQFTNLPAGTYKVCIPDSQAVLSGCIPTITSPPGGGTATNDSNGAGTPNCAMVTLPTDSSSDQTIDFGYVVSSPSMTLVKTTNKTSAKAFEPVVYTYTVTNTGGTTLTNIVIVDDYGTPNFAGDDFTVVSGLTLLAGQSQSFQFTLYPPIKMCTPVNSVPVDAGTLVVQVLANGDVQAIFRQSTNLVDNTYGTNASAGWPSGHTWSNFTGSDKAWMKFYNGAGTLVLDATFDYITAAASATFGGGTVSYPSGYGTLGTTGGDGSLATGLASNILKVETTITKNLNQSPAFYGYIVNSPAPPANFPTWDYVDGYTVLLKGSTFGASGFGSLTLAGVHNSPAKTGTNLSTPTPCDSYATNIARATAKSGTIVLTAQATATVHITLPAGPPPPPCTYNSVTQGGWGATPSGSNPGMLLKNKFATVYPGGSVTIGGGFTLKFTSASAIDTFLPAGGKPKALAASAVNPASGKDTVFAGQVLALRLNVDFSNAGVTPTGLAALKLKSGKLAGQTVAQVLALANTALGGGALPSGISLSDINTACDTINSNYDGGNKGNLIP